MGFRDRKGGASHREKSKGATAPQEITFPPPRFVAVVREISTGVRQLQSSGEVPWLSFIGTMFPAGRAELLFPLEQTDDIADLMKESKRAYEESTDRKVTASGLHVVGAGADVDAEAKAHAELRGEGPA